ncbi:hypothetical protein D3874_00600 [Oleomonas cavernae]|uniref:AbiEi antitoxin C-terminal domain-containing protein n=2 Tax=Oleomonas cavernae TaxID=2320859 RepID=A0A418WT56_9PROT|nr:hypothetical protein D3874_00600 [Oleomonas cavernae]
MRGLMAEESGRKLYIRPATPPADQLRRVIDNLIGTLGLDVDPDYGRGVYRVPSVGGGSAEAVCALVNPFGYVSHLSAMQRWGLTERRPEALHLTMPTPSAARAYVDARMMADYGQPFPEMPAGSAVKLMFIRPPAMVRGRPIDVIGKARLGRWLAVRGTHERLATIGQTFFDMLDTPQRCGGMAHVIDIWREHAPTYLDDIVAAIDESDAAIVKVRAGYLLDEVIGAGDARTDGWLRFAARGGSRVLDPAKDFATAHSEKWMLSINV